MGIIAQDPFSIASQLDAASQPLHALHAASKPFIMAHQPRHTYILSLKVHVSVALPFPLAVSVWADTPYWGCQITLESGVVTVLVPAVMTQECSVFA